MVSLLLRVAFGLAVAALAIHWTTASLDEVTTPFDPAPVESTIP